MKPFETLLGLLRSDILGEDPEALLPSKPDDAFWQNLYGIAANYDLAHIVAHRLGALCITPGGGTAPQFERQHLMALYRYEQMQYEYERVRHAFQEARIPFLPLKGLLMRRLYPKGYLRTSCDMDILVREEQLEEALGVLEGRLHYENRGRMYHDVSLYSESGVHLELHFALVDKNKVSRAEEPLADIWQQARPVTEGDFEYHMDPALFYYYHIAHMAKHMAAGGCGIRPFLDLALLHRKLATDEARKQALLAAGGLATFERVCLELTDCWFGDAAYTPLSYRLAVYIAKGGVYGSMQNKVALRKKAPGKAQYLFSRIWIPYQDLVSLYPAAKHRILVPFFQLRRICTRMFSKSFSRAVQETRAVHKLSNEDCASAQLLMQELELSLPSAESTQTQ